MLFLLCAFTNAKAQDSLYTRRVLYTLASKEYHGRGYVQNGSQKAAAFIENEFRSIGLQPFGTNFRQHFEFPVNTFPSKVELTIGSTQLVPGRDYLVHAASKGVKGNFRIKKLEDADSLWANSNKGCALLIDTGIIQERALIQQLDTTDAPAPLLIFIKDKKLTWTVSNQVTSSTIVEVLRESLPEFRESAKVHIKQQFIPDYPAENIIGWLPGKEKPDSFLVVSAHYDHLGRMGKKTCFPGANDNASGVSMLLNLARHYQADQNYSKYSLVFIAFAGEEAGLIGSAYYCEHPLFPLEKIRFLINLDLLGTGEEGLMAVNGEILPEAFSGLRSINDSLHLLPEIKARGKAKNSDHYYFTEKGVPAFFLYTLGGIRAYHDIYDIPETLPLTGYKSVFRLITEFLKTR